MSFEFSSAAFDNESVIPNRHTCTGEDISPPLRWRHEPPGTRSFALLVEDPDAPRGTFAHWLVYNIPPEVHELSDGVPKRERLDSGALQGTSDFRTVGYGGPCPPAGRPHHFVFRLFALDQPLNLAPGARRKELLKAMEGHVLDEKRLTGIFAR